MKGDDNEDALIDSFCRVHIGLFVSEFVWCYQQLVLIYSKPHVILLKQPTEHELKG